MIRVLHVIGSMGSGGAETMIMNLYRNIDRSMIQFDFLVHTDKQSFYDSEIKELGGNIFHIPKYNILNYFDYKRKIDDFMMSHTEIQIVHGHINSSAFIYLNSARLNNKATILHCHASKRTDMTMRAIAFEISAVLVRKIPDYYLACSYKAGEERFGKNVVKLDDFEVLENGICTEDYKFNIDKRQMIRKELNVNSDKIVIGHVGRFTHAKNHVFIIEVFERFYEKHPNSVLLLIGDGELKPDIESRVQNMKCANSVIFLGVKTNVNDYLQAMDVFIFPSVFEGLGMSLIEAQASGLPCVVSDNIQQEADMKAGLLNVLPINKNVDLWVEKIWEVYHSYVRVDTSRYVLDSGFDIIDSSNKLTDIYSRLLR